MLDLFFQISGFSPQDTLGNSDSPEFIVSGVSVYCLALSSTGRKRREEMLASFDHCSHLKSKLERDNGDRDEEGEEKSDKNFIRYRALVTSISILSYLN